MPRRVLRTSETVKGQAGDAGDSREILVERKNACAMFKCSGGNQCIDRGERNAFRAGCPIDRGRFPIGCEPCRLEHVPLRQKLLNPTGIPSETLQDLGNYDSSKREGFTLVNHAPEFRARAPGRRAKEVHPDGAIDEDQSRFLRDAFRSPFQIPAP